MAARRAPLIIGRRTAGGAATRYATRPGRADYIDGEVIDVVDVDQPPAVEPRPTRLSDDRSCSAAGFTARPCPTPPRWPSATASVAWLGSDDVGRAQFPDAEVIDLDGGFVAPAFVDSHVHVTATGLTLTGLDLRAATSTRHCLELLGRLRARPPRRRDLGARVGRIGLAGRQPPSTADVDAVVGDRPAYLARIDVHSAARVDRAAARRRAVGGTGIRPAAPSDGRRPPPGPRGRPRPAHVRSSAARPAPPPSTWRRPRGIVAVHECAGPDIGGLDDWRELRDTAARRRDRRLLGRGGRRPPSRP